MGKIKQQAIDAEERGEGPESQGPESPEPGPDACDHCGGTGQVLDGVDLLEATPDTCRTCGGSGKKTAEQASLAEMPAALLAEETPFDPEPVTEATPTPVPLPQEEPKVVAYLNQLMRRLTAVRVQANANKVAFAEEMAELIARQREIEAPFVKRDGELVVEIERVGRWLLLMHPGKKSRALLYGEVGTRKTQPGVEIADEEALREFIAKKPRERGIMLLPPKVPDVSKTGVKEFIKAEGEVPPGVETIPEGTKFWVKLTKED